MQQKLAIVCALIKKTDIIILDEPTLGLDVEMEWKMREIFKNKDFLNGRTILISSHNMNFIESVCDRVIIINKGSIIEDNKISKLKSFFKAKEYEIVVTTPSNLKIFDIIKEKFEVNIKSDTNITKLSLITSNSIQSLIDIMKFVSETGLNIISIYSLEPNLEKIYTKIMKNKIYE
jgi:ABC-2 type transport system ATP-binding protein